MMLEDYRAADAVLRARLRRLWRISQAYNYDSELAAAARNSAILCSAWLAVVFAVLALGGCAVWVGTL